MGTFASAIPCNGGIFTYEDILANNCTSLGLTAQVVLSGRHINDTSLRVIENVAMSVLSITIANTSITTTESLYLIEAGGGPPLAGLIVIDNAYLRIARFPHMYKVLYNFQFERNAQLLYLNATSFPALTNILIGPVIQDNPSLQEISLFQTFAVIGGPFIVRRNAALEAFGCCSSVSSTATSLRITDHPSLVTIEVPSPQMGALEVRNNPVLRSLNGLGVRTVTTELTVADCANFVELGMVYLSSVSGTMKLLNLPLESYSRLAALQTLPVSFNATGSCCPVHTFFDEPGTRWTPAHFSGCRDCFTVVESMDGNRAPLAGGVVMRWKTVGPVPTKTVNMTSGSSQSICTTYPGYLDCIVGPATTPGTFPIQLQTSLLRLPVPAAQLIVFVSDDEYYSSYDTPAAATAAQDTPLPLLVDAGENAAIVQTMVVQRLVPIGIVVCAFVAVAYAVAARKSTRSWCGYPPGFKLLDPYSVIVETNTDHKAGFGFALRREQTNTGALVGVCVACAAVLLVGAFLIQITYDNEISITSLRPLELSARTGAAAAPNHYRSEIALGGYNGECSTGTNDTCHGNLQTSVSGFLPVENVKTQCGGSRSSGICIITVACEECRTSAEMVFSVKNEGPNVYTRYINYRLQSKDYAGGNSIVQGSVVADPGRMFKDSTSPTVITNAFFKSSYSGTDGMTRTGVVTRYSGTTPSLSVSAATAATARGVGVTLKATVSESEIVATTTLRTPYISAIIQLFSAISALYATGAAINVLISAIQRRGGTAAHAVSPTSETEMASGAKSPATYS
jgi:hypothetical protein